MLHYQVYIYIYIYLLTQKLTNKFIIYNRHTKISYSETRISQLQARKKVIMETVEWVGAE